MGRKFDPLVYSRAAHIAFWKFDKPFCKVQSVDAITKKQNHTNSRLSMTTLFCWLLNYAG